MATYATAAQLRDELGVTSTVLPDEDADRLIETAEDLIDAQLTAPRDSDGEPLAINETTGRRVTQADVDAWRWTKLSQATVLVAADLYTDPGLAKGRMWQSERGPDFALSGPLGDDLGRRVAGLLAMTGWYGRRSGSARVGSILDDVSPTTRTLPGY